ncbi:Serine protease inhibitor [Entamoeba marina]
MKAALSHDNLTNIRNSMYDFITKYHLVNPLDDDIFSAYSMFLAFAVIYPGANGKTKKQLEEVFGFNNLTDGYEQNVAYLLDSKRDDDIIVLENTQWIDKKFAIKKQYLKVTNKMQSIVNTSNFSTNPKDERIRINKHVEKVTHNLIKDILPQDSISIDTTLVITNSIYFKDKWQKEFDLMEKGINFKSVGEVQSMEVQCYLQFTITKNSTTVSIPYENGYYLTIVMPNDMNSFEKSSDFKQMNKLISTNLHKCNEEVVLKMPLFKLDKTANLKERLIKLGLVDAFKPIADFGNIASDILFIGGVFHKSFISVNEKDTEASAATAIEICRECLFSSEEDPTEIIIDKPFYGIISRTDALPLFFSKVSHPKY